jgi:hypothetical protein
MFRFIQYDDGMDWNTLAFHILSRNQSYVLSFEWSLPAWLLASRPEVVH